MPDRPPSANRQKPPGRPVRDTNRTGWKAMHAWSLALTYGNVPLARQAEETLMRIGWPHTGLAAQVEDAWSGFPAARTGWALNLDGTPREPTDTDPAGTDPPENPEPVQIADPDGRRYVTPSGRRWRAHATRDPGVFVLDPLGWDTHGFGGVKRRRVRRERLTGTDRTWRPVAAPAAGTFEP